LLKMSNVQLEINLKHEKKTSTFLSSSAA